MNTALDECAAKGRAAGLSYGAYMAREMHATRVIVPEHLKDAPTMFERLAGAVAPDAPIYEHVQLALPEIEEEPEEPEKQEQVSWMQEMRIAAGVTVKEIAKLCGVYRRSAYRWDETGRMSESRKKQIREYLEQRMGGQNNAATV